MSPNTRKQERDVARIKQDQALPIFLVKPISNVWRNRILVQLHRRAMSPNQFANEFGLNLATSARYFRELKTWGLLRIVEERRGGNRRGAVEKVYRAIRKVYFDNSNSEHLSLYLREELTEVALEGLFHQLGDALEAGTLDDEGRLSSQLVFLDRQAWRELVDRLDEVLYWLSELEAQSSVRLAQSGAASQPITASLLCFRSPTRPATDWCECSQGQDRPRIGPPGPHFLLNPQTAKALSNPWRHQILIEARVRPINPKQFLDEVGGPDLGTIARCFRQLRDWGYLEILEKRPGRKRHSVIQTVYRATPRTSLTFQSWDAIYPELKSQQSGPFIEALIDQIHQAVIADTMEAETDRHLSWKALLLDSRAWSECVTRLNEIQVWSQQLETESEKRLATGEGEQIPATVASLAFRSPDPRPS